MSTHFGERLRTFRRERGWTSLRALAAELRVSHSLVSLIESGKRVPSRRFLDRLARLFDQDEGFEALLRETLPEEHRRLFAPGQRSPSGIEDVVVPLAELFRDIEKETSPEKVLFYRELLNHLKEHTADERIRAHLRYYEIAFYFLRTPTKPERERLLSECLQLLNDPHVRRDVGIRRRLHEKIGRHYFYAQRYEEALRHYRQAVHHARQEGGDGTEARLLVECARASEAAGEAEEALSFLREAIDCAISVADRAYCRQWLATTLHAIGRLKESESTFKESIRLWRQVFRQRDEVPNELAAAELQLGNLYLDWLRLEEAQRAIQAARTTLRRVLTLRPGDLYGLYQLAQVECTRARLRLSAGRIGHARNILHRIIDQYQGLQHSWRDFILAVAYRELGRAAGMRGETEEAVSYLEKAVALSAVTPNPILEWETKIWLAEAKLALGEESDAETALGSIRPSLREGDSRHQFILALLECLRGELAFRRKECEEGTRAYRRACEAALSWHPACLDQVVIPRLRKEREMLHECGREAEREQLDRVLFDLPEVRRKLIPS